MDLCRSEFLYHSRVNYFLPSCGLSFEFSLIVFFKKQEFLILMKSRIHMFPFMGSDFDVVSENT